MTKKTQTEFIKQQALELGFDACGIAKAEFLKEDSVFFSRWLEKGFHAKMSYLERNIDKRFNPNAMVEGCKSVIVVMMNYFPSELQKISYPKIAKYAYSKIDYHTVIREKLTELEKRIVNQFGDECFNPNFQYLFVDSAPVLERRWAEKAGLGWIGKNKMVIHPQFGSHFFLGELFINIDLEYDSPIKNRCGTCNKCIESCPTNALSVEFGLNSQKCISYQTIENKQDIDVEIQKKLSGYAFGCDICNDVCPWNKSKNKSHGENGLETSEEIINWNSDDWENLTKGKFSEVFKNSAIKRAGFEKLKHNINLTLNNS